MPSLFSFQRIAVFPLMLGFAVSAALAGSANTGLPNFQKVDDQVYRGAQPTGEGFQVLAQRGIKTVIDLRNLGEHSQAEEQRLVTAAGMKYVSIPMREMATPDPNKVAAVEALLSDSTNGPVFVHCKRGADRTGMVIAIYRINHDHWENHRALVEAKSIGMSPFQFAIHHYVHDYKPTVTLASGDAIVSGNAVPGAGISANAASADSASAAVR